MRWKVFYWGIYALGGSLGQGGARSVGQSCLNEGTFPGEPMMTYIAALLQLYCSSSSHPLYNKKSDI